MQKLIEPTSLAQGDQMSKSDCFSLYTKIQANVGTLTTMASTADSELGFGEKLLGIVQNAYGLSGRIYSGGETLYQSGRMLTSFTRHTADFVESITDRQTRNSIRSFAGRTHNSFQRANNFLQNNGGRAMGRFTVGVDVVALGVGYATNDADMMMESGTSLGVTAGSLWNPAVAVTSFVGGLIIDTWEAASIKAIEDIEGKNIRQAGLNDKIRNFNRGVNTTNSWIDQFNAGGCNRFNFNE